MKKRNTLILMIIATIATIGLYIFRQAPILTQTALNQKEVPINESKIPLAKKVARKISSQVKPTSTIPSLKNKYLKRDGKIIQGVGADKFTDIDVELEMVNSYDPNWKEKTEQSALRFQDPETKIEIKEILSLIEISKHRGRHIEIVQITMERADGVRSSFRAKIDGQSGKIIKTWDQTYYERNIGQDISLEN